MGFGSSSSSSSSWRVGLGFALAIVATMACSNSDGDYDNEEDLNEAVISCEDAFARLENCCPGFDATETAGCIERTYQQTSHGCDGQRSFSTGHQTPTLSLAESKCIRNLSCEAIVSQKVCERAKKAPAPETGSWSSEDPLSTGNQSQSGDVHVTHPPVCP